MMFADSGSLETSGRSARHHAAAAGKSPATIALATALAFCQPARSQTAPPKPSAPAANHATAAIDAGFDAFSNSSDLKSAILLVRVGSAPLATRGHNADPSAPTLIGSMSKAITGACVATLVRDGKLSFKTPMSEALAGFFRENGRPLDPRFEAATIEQLLTHRSGLHDNRDDPFFEIRRQRIAERQADVASPWPLLKAMLGQNMLTTEPGSTYAYSNSGFLALTAVIEERSGQPFETYCREKVFIPLGLASAGLNPDWRMLGGFGGWYITGDDYLSFLKIFDHAHPFLGPAAKAWIDLTGMRARIAKKSWYSLGLHTHAQRGRWSVWHAGKLGSRGRDARDRPITAYINSIASREPSGVAIFIAVSPKSGVAKMPGKVSSLHKRVGKIASDWLAARPPR